MAEQINLDTLKILWGCPECLAEEEGSFGETADGWPICSSCLPDAEIYMEYSLEASAELYDEGGDKVV